MGLLTLKQLRVLLVDRNKLSGSVPDCSNLSALNVLNVANNQLDSFNWDPRNCANLQELLLDDNNLRALPLELGVCPQLRVLQVMGNKIRTIKPNVLQEGNTTLMNQLKKLIPFIQPTDIGHASIKQYKEKGSVRLLDFSA